MEILSRLALVIHWIGFLIGLSFSLFLMRALLFNETNDSPDFFMYLAIALGFIIPWLIGWVIRFILVGNINLLPWAKVTKLNNNFNESGIEEKDASLNSESEEDWLLNFMMSAFVFIFLVFVFGSFFGLIPF